MVRRLDRRKFIGTTAAAGLALVAKPHIARAAKHELLVAEPVHSTGYLPMYIAMAKDYFAEADINVKIVTIETGQETFQARARTAEGAERERLYAAQAALMPTFAEYKHRTTRQIPVVVLERLP